MRISTLLATIAVALTMAVATARAQKVTIEKPGQPDEASVKAKAQPGAAAIAITESVEARPRPEVERAESKTAFAIHRKQLRLEAKILAAEIAMKKAEIKRVEAEQKIRDLAPTLKILTMLDAKVAMNFPNETPLEDVLKYIKQSTQDEKRGFAAGLPIYIDPVGLQEAEKTLASTVTLDLQGLPLRTTLSILLRQLNLAYQVKDGLLTITSPEQIAEDDDDDNDDEDDDD